MGRCQGHILKRVAEGKSDRVLDVVLRVRSPRRSPLRATRFSTDVIIGQCGVPALTKFPSQTCLNPELRVGPSRNAASSGARLDVSVINERRSIKANYTGNVQLGSDSKQGFFRQIGPRSEYQ